MTVKTLIKASLGETSFNDFEGCMYYSFFVSLGDLKWKIQKRFSDFDDLLFSLDWEGCVLLPALPPKTLPMMGLSGNEVTARATALEKLLRKLLARQDVRGCKIFRTFLCGSVITGVNDVGYSAGVASSALNADSVKWCDFQISSTLDDGRFGITAFQGVLKDNDFVVYTAQGDSTGFSRLGRMWSVVESDELGAFYCWNKREGLWVSTQQKFYAHKVTCLSLSGIEDPYVLIGMETGQVVGFPENSAEPCLNIELHGKNPVIDITCNKGMLYSVGLDGALRVYDLKNKGIFAGGRLSKRLTSGQFLRRIKVSSQVYVATNTFEIFVFDLSTPPKPELLDVLRVPPSSCIRDIALAPNGLYVAHDSYVSLFDVKIDKTEANSCLSVRHTVITIGFENISKLSLNGNLLGFGTEEGSAGIIGLGKAGLKGELLVAGRTCIEASVTDIQWRDDRNLAVSSDDGRLRFWDTSATLISDEYMDQEDRDSSYAVEGLQKSPIVSAAVGGGTSALTIAEEGEDDSWNKGMFN